MSAAATAAGYLYASGRLRGRKDLEDPEKRERFSEKRERFAENRERSTENRERFAENRGNERPPAARRRPLRVAAIREAEHFAPPQPAPRTRPAPRIEYRTRRWRPGE
jgi:hypothetical protein